jgi:hypothetical protein
MTGSEEVKICVIDGTEIEVTPDKCLVGLWEHGTRVYYINLSEVFHILPDRFELINPENNPPT